MFPHCLNHGVSVKLRRYLITPAFGGVGYFIVRVVVAANVAVSHAGLVTAVPIPVGACRLRAVVFVCKHFNGYQFHFQYSFRALSSAALTLTYRASAELYIVGRLSIFQVETIHYFYVRTKKP